MDPTHLAAIRLLRDAGAVALTWEFEGRNGAGVAVDLGALVEDDLPEALTPGSSALGSHFDSAEECVNASYSLQHLPGGPAVPSPEVVAALCCWLLSTYWPIDPYGMDWRTGHGSSGSAVLDLRTGALIVDGVRCVPTFHQNYRAAAVPLGPTTLTDTITGLLT
jgi:hypothetical protein